jgi:hypothetical protein
VHESGSIDASIDRVWDVLRPLDFSFLPSVATSVVENRQNPAKVGSERRVLYKDGTMQLLKLTELNDATFTLTWDVIMSEPAVSYTSAVHTIRLRRVTQPTKQTLVELISDYSSDASLEVIEDSRFKKLELVKALRDAVLGRGQPAGLQAFVRRAEQAEELIRLLTARMDQLERSRGAESKESKSNDGIILQVSGALKAGKAQEAVAAVRDCVERVIKPAHPGIVSHSGLSLTDDSHFLSTIVFKDSASLLSFQKSKELQQFHASALTNERAAFDSFKFTVIGNLSQAARDAVAHLKPTLLPNNGFSR